MTASRHTELSPQQVEELRQALLEARRRLTATEGGARGDHRGDPNCYVDEGDAATAARDRHRTERLSAHQRHELAEVEAALTRIEDGSYGLCESTGEPIGYPRLHALPWARRCAAAQEDEE